MYTKVSTPARIYRFDGFEANLDTGELFRHGIRIPLQALPLHLLAALLERPGEVLSREELRDRIWPEEINLDFDAALATALRKLRQALGDSCREPRYVETLPGRGYRYVGPVETAEFIHVNDPVVAGQLACEVRLAPPVVRSRRRFLAWVGLGLGGLLLGSSLLLWAVAGKAHKVPVPPSGPSVLVLPARLLGVDGADAFLADAVAETLTSALAGTRSVETKVPPTSQQAERYKGDLGAIAKAYVVDSLVVSSLTHGGQEFALAVRLVDAPTQKVLWGGQFVGSREGCLELAREAARGLLAAMRVGHGGNDGAAPVRMNPAAELALREGRFLTKKFGFSDPTRLEQAVRVLQRAQATEPSSSLLAAELGWALSLSHFLTRDEAAFRAAQRWAERALELDANCGLAWAVHSTLEMNRHKGSSERLADCAVRALALSPEEPRIHQVFGTMAPTFGMQSAAGFQMIEQDPLDMMGYGRAALGLTMTGRPEEAMAVLDRALSLDEDGFCRWLRFETLARLGRKEEAVRNFAPGGAAKPRLKEIQGDPAGARQEMQQILSEFRKSGSGGMAWPPRAALGSPILVRLGMREEALGLLEGAHASGAALPLDWLLGDPDLAPLREDPRYLKALALSRDYARHFHRRLAEAQRRGALPRYLESSFHELGRLLERAGG